MLQLLIREWPNVLSLLAGLIAIKTLITTALGTRVGLTLQESIRIGLLLSQGGEFGFVVFSLANRSVFFWSLPFLLFMFFQPSYFRP
jgi:Kef-type K+ transport system membrane component KefB